MNGSLKRHSRVYKEKEEKHPPILPKGMTKRTLYDDHLFDKWFQECFRNPPPSQEHIIQKRVRKNQRKAKRRRERLERERMRKETSKTDLGYSTESRLDDEEEDEDNLEQLNEDYSDDSSELEQN